jgi:hypothetical protein
MQRPPSFSYSLSLWERVGVRETASAMVTCWKAGP